MSNENDFLIDKLKFEINIETPSGSVVKINPLAQVAINEENVKEEIRLLPAQYAFFTSAYLTAKKKFSLMEFQVNNLKNECAKALRIKAKESNTELNNKQVEELVSSSKIIADSELQLIQLQAEKDQLYYLCVAIEKKEKSLSSLSYMQNRERDVNNAYNKDKAFSDSAINTGINPNRFDSSK